MIHTMETTSLAAERTGDIGAHKEAKTIARALRWQMNLSNDELTRVGEDASR